MSERDHEKEEELNRLRSFSSPPAIDFSDYDDDIFPKDDNSDDLVVFDRMMSSPPRNSNNVDFIDPQLCLLIFRQTPGKLVTTLLPIVYLFDHQCFFARTRLQVDTESIKDTMNYDVLPHAARYRANDMLPVLYVEKDLRNTRFAPLKRDQKLNFPDLHEIKPLSVDGDDGDRVPFAVHETLMVIKSPNTARFDFARTCLHCVKLAARHQVWKRCSGCRHAYYCSTECQEESWDVFHSKVCGRLLRMKTKSEDTYYNFNNV